MWASSAAQYWCWASRSAWSFFTRSSRRRISFFNFWSSAEDGAVRAGDVGAGAEDRGAMDDAEGAGHGGAATVATGAEDAEKRFERAGEDEREGAPAGANSSSAGCGTEPAGLGWSKFFTRTMRSCGCKGLRINSSALTAMARSA